MRPAGHTLPMPGLNPVLQWEVLSRVKPPNSLNEKCNLCLLEGLYILLSNKELILNTRTELIKKCRHVYKYELPEVTPTHDPPDDN